MKSISSIALGKVNHKLKEEVRGPKENSSGKGKARRKEVSVPHAKKHEIMKMDKRNMKDITFLIYKERKKSGTNVQHANSI